MFSIRTISTSKHVLRNTRAFHSPFHLLGAVSPLTTPHSAYEKQAEHSPAPTTTHSGTQTYVVSEPDPLDRHYNVPSGAYPTTAPYQNFDAVAYDSSAEFANKSSTSSETAHPTLTNQVPTHEGGVGESASIRYGSAPGEMGSRGAGNGGLGLMDKEGTRAGKGGELPDVNPGPTDSDAVVEKNARLGVKEAWKQRK